MLGDPDNESVSDRLSEAVWDRLSFIFPLRIIKQPERVTILDYRPTLAMFLTGVGLLLVGALVGDDGTVTAPIVILNWQAALKK